MKPGARLRLGGDALSTALLSQSLGVAIGEHPRLLVELNWAWDWMLDGGDPIVDVALGVQF